MDSGISSVVNGANILGNLTNGIVSKANEIKKARDFRDIDIQKSQLLQGTMKDKAVIVKISVASVSIVGVACDVIVLVLVPCLSIWYLFGVELVQYKCVPSYSTAPSSAELKFVPLVNFKGLVPAVAVPAPICK